MQKDSFAVPARYAVERVHGQGFVSRTAECSRTCAPDTISIVDIASELANRAAYWRHDMLTHPFTDIYRRAIHTESTHMRNWVNGPPLNYAAGIEIGVNAVRAVVLGYGRQSRHASPWMRLIHAGQGAVAAGAMSGVDILEPRNVASALVDAFGGPQDIQGWTGAQASVGLPPSTVLTRTVALSQLAGHRASRTTCLMPVPRRGEPTTLDRFEEGVLAAAERMMALDRNELCVDWFRAPSANDVEQATIVATTRQQVQTRVTTAALAGLRVSTVDGEADAALRACRHWAHIRHPAARAFIALWAGPDDTRTWCLRDGAIELLMIGDREFDMDRLRVWAHHATPELIVTAGGAAEFGRRTPDPEQMARALGCGVEPFDPALCCPCVDPAKPLQAGPDYAVAFGLALRGVE
jgi:Tfp pilus assembly PilM family ATPase